VVALGVVGLVLLGILLAVLEHLVKVLQAAPAHKQVERVVVERAQLVAHLIPFPLLAA
jgi:hypothetical protein